jgi:hypothetical protein
MSDNVIDIVPEEPLPRTPAVLDVTSKAFKANLKRRAVNRSELLEWVKDSLVSGSDFMRIKSRRGWSKPFLTKSGAEKILGMLAVTPEFPNLDETVKLLANGANTNIVLICELVNADSMVVATGAGARTLKQDSGDINKAIKMALKSAMIDATLRLGGLSEVFTQDEESAHDDHIDPGITKKQLDTLTELAGAIKMPLVNVCRYYEIEKLSDLPQSKYLRATKALQKRGQTGGTEQ